MIFTTCHDRSKCHLLPDALFRDAMHRTTCPMRMKSPNQRWFVIELPIAVVDNTLRIVLLICVPVIWANNRRDWCQSNCLFCTYLAGNLTFVASAITSSIRVSYSRRLFSIFRISFRSVSIFCMAVSSSSSLSLT